MSAFSQIDLSELPAPDVVETIDYEDLLAEIKAALVAKDPDLEAVLGLESDPLNKLVEVFAYREMLLRQRVNEGAKAVQLAHAVGADLDNLAAIFGVQRAVVAEADEAAIPPIPAVFESDNRLRARAQLALEGFTNAGSTGAYTFHALSADAVVRDVSVTSPVPGDVLVTVLSEDSDGAPSSALLSAVSDALNSEAVRPLTDTVIVAAAAITDYTVVGAITLYPGPDAETIRAAAESAVADYVAARWRLGHDVTRSGLFAALHQPGVQNVAITSPAADIIIDDQTAAHCSAITVTVAGVDV